MRYGVPLDTNAMVLIYNVDHFREAGVPEPDPKTPMSLQAFADLARSVTNASHRAIAIPTSNWWTYGWIKANAGEVVEVGSDGRSKLTLDAPKVVEGVDFLADLIAQDVAFPPRGVDAHSDDAFALFGAGKVSMHTSGSWDVANLEKENLGINYRIVLMPQEPGGGTVMGGSSMWVPAASENRDLAVEFMTLLASDPYALRFAKEEGRLPVRPTGLRRPLLQRARPPACSSSSSRPPTRPGSTPTRRPRPTSPSPSTRCSGTARMPVKRCAPPS